VCRICIVPGLDRDTGCRRMGNGFARLVVAVAAAAAAVVELDVEIDVDVGVAEVVPDRLAVEAVTEADSSSTCPSRCFDHQAKSAKDRRCQSPYSSW
jgi:hypothetical protein